MKSPRELWMLFGVLFFHGFLYYSIVLVLPLFLTDEFGYSDSIAGVIYGCMGASYTLFAILLGTTVDRVGVKYTEMYSSVMLMVGAILLAFSFNVVLMVFAIILFLPLGGCVSYPAGKIATRRFTSPISRSMAFSIFFMVTQLSAVIGFGVDDIFTHMSSNHFFSSYRQIFFLSGCLMVITVVLTVFMREMDYEASGDAEVAALGSNYTTCQIIKDLVGSKGFWRYVLLVCMATGIRIVYRSMDATLPKFMERTIGEGAYYGIIMMLNPLAILIFTPLFTPLVYWFTNYTLICVGGFICSASCLFMLLEPSYLTCAAFSFTIGVGESIWSPRFYEYSIDVSPKGKEGTYMALTSAPLFVASMISGVVSGNLLETYCPEDGGTGQCWVVWLVITLLAISSPVLLVLLRSCIDQPKYSETIADGTEDRSD
jgi:MFS family permease